MNLTKREKQIMSLLWLGLKDRTMANMLGLSVRTVQNHLSRIYLKLGAKNRTQAITRFLDIYGQFALDSISGEENEKNNFTLECGNLYSVVNGF